MPLYTATIAVFGGTISWCSAACNSPLFAEVVPPEQRALIYAFDRCFEGALAACAAPAVGIIAERAFGFDAAAAHAASTSQDALAAADRANATALGNSLLWCLCAPWLCCAAFYTLLYRAYPADRAALKARSSRDDSDSV